MSWTTSDRRKRLPANWSTITRQIKARDKGQCQATKHHPRCDRKGTEVDHIQPGDNHHPDNLQLLNHWCHQQKTQTEVATLNQQRAKMRQRPTEQHPGTITPATKSGEGVQTRHATTDG